MLREGGCTLPRVSFTEVVRTYQGRLNLDVEADPRGLRIGTFSMPVESYSPDPKPPGKS